MAKNDSKKMKDALRAMHVAKIVEFLTKEGEDVRYTASGTLVYPVCDEAGHEYFIKMVISIPQGSRDGDAYNGYEEAEAYELKLKQDAEKAKAKAKAKAEKIARDEARRVKASEQK